MQRPPADEKDGSRRRHHPALVDALAPAPAYRQREVAQRRALIAPCRARGADEDQQL
jgi:hypothetical protein